jgi:peptide deformylase (EC 3.5.1.88)
MTLQIRTYPDEVLRNKSKVIKDINGNLVKLAEQMAETMYLSRGIGLAAPQVGEPCCLIVMDVGEGLIEIFNPTIISSEGLAPFKEGCLSLPEITLEIKRPDAVVVKGINRNGKEITIEARDLMARVVQHEIDHLQGTLIIDRISKAHRQLIRGKLKKLRQENT